MKECTITSEQMFILYRRIGGNVKRIRTQKGVTQLELAQAIGHKAVGTISVAELCLNEKHFNIEHLYKIAEVLEVDICEFFQAGKD